MDPCFLLQCLCVVCGGFLEFVKNVNVGEDVDCYNVCSLVGFACVGFFEWKVLSCGYRSMSNWGRCRTRR